MQEFSGEEHFAVDQQRLYAELTNLDSLAASIPDLVSCEQVGPQTLNCVVRPGFSFLRGTLKLTIAMRKDDPPSAASARVDARGIGVTIGVQSQMQITAEGTGSRLVWQAQISQMKGLVASVSPGLVKAAADQVIGHAWQRVRQRLGGDYIPRSDEADASH